MNKILRLVIWLIVIGALAGGGFIVYEHATAAPERTYRTAAVKKGSVLASISSTGTVEPEEVVDIGAQVAGRINSFGKDKAGKQIDYGSVVEADTILAEIDSALYASDLAEAQAQLEVDRAGVTKAQADLEQLKAKADQAKADADQSKARLTQAQADLDQFKAKLDQTKSDVQQFQAKLDQASKDWDRAQKLGPSDALSQESYDGYKAAFESARANLVSSQTMIAQAQASIVSDQAVIVQAQANIASTHAVIGQAQANIASGTASIEQAKATVTHDEAGVLRAKQNVDYCTIKSPVKGVIIDRRVNIGQTVVSSLNAPSLFLLAKDLTRMQVWVSVNEADIGNIHPAQPVTFTVDAFPGAVFKGDVGKVRLNATMTQNVVTYTVEVETDNSDNKLLPYLTANAQFEVARKEDVLLVPNAALRWVPSSAEILPEVADDQATEPGQGKAAKDGAPADAHGSGPKKDGAGGKSGMTRAKVWVKEGNFVRAIRVRTGISDGTNTEVQGKELTDGMEVVVGKLMQGSGKGGGGAAADGGTTNPFAPKFPSRNPKPATKKE